MSSDDWMPPPGRIFLIADNIRSGYNTGALFRISAFLGVQELWLCGITPAPPHREVLKTALGTAEQLTWKTSPDTAEVIQQLRTQYPGIRICALENRRGGSPLTEWMAPSPQPGLAVICGNEVEGISEHVLQHVDEIVFIPAFGPKESLNVVVATGIFLWEIIRQWVHQKTPLSL